MKFKYRVGQKARLEKPKQTFWPTHKTLDVKLFPSKERIPPLGAVAFLIFFFFFFPGKDWDLLREFTSRTKLLHMEKSNFSLEFNSFLILFLLWFKFHHKGSLFWLIRAVLNMSAWFLKPLAFMHTLTYNLFPWTVLSALSFLLDYAWGQGLSHFQAQIRNSIYIYFF